MGRRGLLRVAILRPLSAKVAIPVVAVAVWCLAAALPGSCRGLLARRPEHLARAASRPERQGARHLSREGQGPASPGLGRRQRAQADEGAAAGRLQVRLRRRLRAATGSRSGRRFKNKCGPYRGPDLPWLVAACTAPDGSHWAIQKWKRSQANFGLPPCDARCTARASSGSRTGRARSPSSRPGSTGATAAAGITSSVGYTYRGKPVHGYKSTPRRAAARLVRPGPLPRHLQLEARARVEAGERVPRASAGRLVLLRARPASLVRRAASAGQRRVLPPHRRAGPASRRTSCGWARACTTSATGMPTTRRTRRR